MCYGHAICFMKCMDVLWACRRFWKRRRYIKGILYVLWNVWMCCEHAVDFEKRVDMLWARYMFYETRVCVMGRPLMLERHRYVKGIFVCFVKRMDVLWAYCVFYETHGCAMSMLYVLWLIYPIIFSSCSWHNVETRCHKNVRFYGQWLYIMRCVAYQMKKFIALYNTLQDICTINLCTEEADELVMPV